MTVDYRVHRPQQLVVKDTVVLLWQVELGGVPWQLAWDTYSRRIRVAFVRVGREGRTEWTQFYTTSMTAVTPDEAALQVRRWTIRRAGGQRAGWVERGSTAGRRRIG